MADLTAFQEDAFEPPAFQIRSGVARSLVREDILYHPELTAEQREAYNAVITGTAPARIPGTVPS